MNFGKQEFVNNSYPLSNTPFKTSPISSRPFQVGYGFQKPVGKPVSNQIRLAGCGWCRDEDRHTLTN